MVLPKRLTFCFLIAFIQASLAAVIPNLCPGNEVIISNGNQEIIGTLGSPQITSATYIPQCAQEMTSFQYGDVNLSGDLPIGGSIKVSGCFPVYGLVSVEGSLPSAGTAVVNTGCQFPSQNVAGTNIFETDCGCV